MKKILFVILSLFLVSYRPLYTAFCVSNKSSMPIAVCADFLPKGDTILKKAKYGVLLSSNETYDITIYESDYKRLKSGDTLLIFVVNKNDLNMKNGIVNDSCKILEKTYLDWNRLRNEYSFTYYGE